MATKREKGLKFGIYFDPVPLIVVIALFVFITIAGMLSFLSVYGESINSIRQQNHAIANRLDGWLNVKINQLTNNHIFLLDPDIDTQTLVRSFTQQGLDESVSMIMVGLPDGSFIHGGVWESADEVHAPDRIWYIAAAERPGEIVFLPPYWGPATQRFVFTVTRTVSDYDTSLGVIAMSMPFYIMQNFLAEETVDSPGHSFVLDSYGNILFHPDDFFAPISDGVFQNARYIDGGIYADMVEAIGRVGSYVGVGAAYVATVADTTGWLIVTQVPISYIIRTTMPTIISLAATALFALAAVISISVAIKRERNAIKAAMEMEKDLEISERIRLMFDAAPLMIEFWDKDHNILDCNKTNLDLYGLTDTKDYRKHLDESYREFNLDGNRERFNEWNNRLNEILETGYCRFEYEQKDKNGLTLFLEVEGTRTKYNNEVAVVTYSKDITQLKEAERKIAEANIQLEDLLEKSMSANRAKSTFLSTMSHEMRTPLNAIIGMATIAKNKENNEHITHCLDSVVDAAHHLLRIVNDVLDISKIEANKLELVNATFNLRNLLDKTFGLLKHRIEEKGHQFSMTLQDNIPDFYVGDDQRITQVIANLLANAITYTPEKGEISLDVSMHENSGAFCKLRFEVRDNGIGISTEQQERLFQMFEQADNSSSRKFGGTGLGLSICRRLLELMGGDISVNSELGRGSSFVFTIKLEKAKSTEVESDNTASLKDTKFTGKRILVAEDIDINIEVLIALLEDTGVLIDSVHNGKEAVELISEKPDVYDLILMDIQMPEMDGLEATRRIRALEIKHLPIIAMTANVFADELEKCFAAGMDDHISKPLDMATVYGKLQKYLRQ